MAPVYHRPENALKRAEELCAVGQQPVALQLLLEIILAKRSRSTPITTLQPIILKFVDLCVDLRKSKAVKEGLHQYKNISQNITVSSIELVIKRFIDQADLKVTEAQAKADKISAHDIEDLEATETPESVMMSTVSGEDNKDRTDREVVTPWLRFLWEAYRTALDILRNNARLELLYQTVANRAFEFCVKYSRKTEFRRLCDVLRQHLNSAAKNTHANYALNLNDPDTLQRHLDTRFVQLNVADQLELWQEAFRSIEDIYNLLATTKKAPKAHMMANYYEKLAKIFAVGENYLFHAAAWNKYYSNMRSNKNLTDEEHQQMASKVLISALAIPIITTSKARGFMENDEAKSKTLRLSHLLRVQRAPTREVLLREALNKNIISRVNPELRELYNILEVQFHPLSICQKIEPIMKTLSDTPELEKYVKPLHQVVFTRLLQQLSQVYTTIRIDAVVKLAAFPAPHGYDAHTIEKFIMAGCKKGELSIRVNHQTQTLTFENDAFAASKGTISAGPRLQSLPSEQMRLQLTRLAKRLDTAVSLIDPTIAQKRKEAKEAAVLDAMNSLKEEYKKNTIRRLLIEKKKEMKENEQLQKEREAEANKKLREKEEMDAEKIRLREVEIRREAERREEMIKKQKEKDREELLKTLQPEKIKEDIENLDNNGLLKIKAEQLQQEKREQAQKIKTLVKRLDHQERAFRLEEIPLLQKDYEAQQKLDRGVHAVSTRMKLDTAKAKHAESMELKARMLRMTEDATDLQKQLQAKRDEENKAVIEAVKAKIEQEKLKRVREIINSKIAAKERREAEERERRRKEAEEELKAAAREEEARQKAIKEAKEREEYLLQKKKLDEQAEIQRERERLAEEKLRKSSTPDTNKPDAWRKEAPKPTDTKPATYVAPRGGRTRIAERSDRREDSSSSAWEKRNLPPSNNDSKKEEVKKEEAPKTKYVPPARRNQQSSSSGDDGGLGQKDTESVDGEPVSSFQSYTAEGDNLAKQGDYQKAIEAYTKALTLRPMQKNCLVSRSKCHLLLGDTKSALADAEASLQQQGSDGINGEIIPNTANNPTSTTSATAATTISDNSSTAGKFFFFKGIYQKAEALYAQGDFEMALVYYHRGNKLRPELDEFRLGIQKSREAIDNSIGNPKDYKFNTPTFTSTTKSNKSKTPGTSKQNQHTGNPLISVPIITNVPTSSQQQSSQMKNTSGNNTTNSAGMVVASGTSAAVGSSGVGGVRKSSVKNVKMVKELLGEIYCDKEYLDDLLFDKDFKTNPNSEIETIVSDALKYLDTRTEFWRQQKPIYARKKEQVKLQAKVSLAAKNRNMKKTKNNVGEENVEEQSKHAESAKKMFRIGLNKINQAITKKDFETALKLSQNLLPKLLNPVLQPFIPDQLAELYLKLGDIYGELLHFNLALQNFKKGLSTLQSKSSSSTSSSPPPTILLRSLTTQTAKTLVKLCKYNDAIPLFQKLLHTNNNAGSSTVHNFIEKAWLYHDIGRCYLELDDLDVSSEYGEKCLKAAKDAGDDKWRLRGFVLLGQCYARMGIYQDAINNYESAVEIAKKITDTKAIDAINRILVDLKKQSTRGRGINEI
ncbi:eukaryotic translation initiation factor 3 subunit A [Nowakowskiella sp. JEL0407]|nr:eukaryotic translation initiation factor 3 subunit A [Nowakowskiella sp. JEL0407]